MISLLKTLLSRSPNRQAETAPIVVGATGGSGTRAMQAMLARAGAFMGSRLNHAGDAMDFEPLLDRWINPILEVTRSLDYAPDALPPSLRQGFAEDFQAALNRFRSDHPDACASGAWGWKNPRSMFILPLIHEAFPGMRFIHLIRDGRDMALSTNQNQPRKHFAALFGEDLPDPVEAGAARLWADANMQIAAWGRRNLGSRYRLVRFEDICADPAGLGGRILESLALDPSKAEPDAFQLPPSSGRWKTADPELRDRITEIARPGLRAFGYV